MGKLILDAATRARFAGLTERVELVDEAGRPVGFYTPPTKYTFDTMPADPVPTDEEIEAAFNQTGPGRPLEDIIRELRAGR